MTVAILGATTDVRMQQATVNLFADMGVQPDHFTGGPDSSNGVNRCNRSQLHDYGTDVGLERASGTRRDDYRYGDRLGRRRSRRR